MKDEENDIELDKEGIDDSVIAEEHAQDSVKKLKDKLKAAEEKAKENLDGWQRAQADFANIRRRDEEAKMEFLKFANASLIEKFIPILDSLELSLPHGNKELEVIYKQFLAVLRSSGLEEVNPLGEAFDPKLHEAIGVIPTEKSEEDHRILEVVQKGYILSGKIIRPAKVRIGEFNN